MVISTKYTEGIQDKICIFEVSRSIFKDPGVLFTDGNASKQQLSDPEKSIGEIVQIIPATVSHPSCRRRYLPDGRPYGTSLSRSNFYGDAALLEYLDWDGINNRRRIDPVEEYVRVRHAEILVPDLLPLSRIHGIFVNKPKMVEAVNALIDQCGLAGRIPSALCRPSLFFY